MARDYEPAPLADRYRCPPPLMPDHFCEERHLFIAVLVRVSGVRDEGCDVGEARVGAVDGDGRGGWWFRFRHWRWVMGLF